MLFTKTVQAREYQERVKREKEMNSDLEVKRKLQERVAKRKEEVCLFIFILDPGFYYNSIVKQRQK